MNYNMKNKIFIFITAFLIPILSTAYGTSGNFRISYPIMTSPSDEYRCLWVYGNGMLWIGTSSGLKSYDGYKFKTYNIHYR